MMAGAIPIKNLYTTRGSRLQTDFTSEAHSRQAGDMMSYPKPSEIPSHPSLYVIRRSSHSSLTSGSAKEALNQLPWGENEEVDTGPKDPHAQPRMHRRMSSLGANLGSAMNWEAAQS